MKMMSALLALVIVSLCVILWLSTPQVWPISQGTLTIKKVAVEGRTYVMIEGEPMNQLGQIQSISVVADGNKLIVNRSIVRWNPISRIIVNNQWPVFYSIDSVDPGKYTVVYPTQQGEVIAGSFDVP